jgi:uncharacterized protein YndB with AHSA1/START domain
MTERSAHHASFVIERQYDASPARVFGAFADPTAKARWFAGPGEWSREGYALDFRVGGREHLVSRSPSGVAHIFDAVYHDIVPNERIIFSYEMHLDDKRISVSLTTVELKRDGERTRLIFTEQGAFLDGFDNPPERERGTKSLLEKLDAEIRRNL